MGLDLLTVATEAPVEDKKGSIACLGVPMGGWVGRIGSSKSGAPDVLESSGKIR